MTLQPNATTPEPSTRLGRRRRAWATSVRDVIDSSGAREQAPGVWLRRGLLQEVTTVVVVVVALSTVQPRGLSGIGLAAVLLTVADSILLASRHVPDTVLSQPGRLVALYLGAVVSAATVSLTHAGIVVAFGFFVAGHAGFRLPSRLAVPVAVACSVLDGGVLLLHIGPGHLHTPWYVGAATGATVLLGMLNRANDSSVAARIDASAAAERAARAEASEHILAERGRIARDVHDTLAHSLAGITVQLDLADALLEREDVVRAREATARARSLVRAGLQEVQRTVYALREDVLPLVPTLAAMFAPARVDVSGEPRATPTDVTQALVRAAQEALTNAQKYAPGCPLEVVVGFAENAVSLMVRNGPLGPDVPFGPGGSLGPGGPGSSGGSGGPLGPGERLRAAGGSGMGLVGMRERIALVGGRVRAGPSADGGWTVEVEVPMST